MIKAKILLFILLTFSLFIQGQITKMGFDCIPTENDTMDGVKVFALADDMPVFKGGDLEFFKFYNSHINYPVLKNNEEVETKVIITFVVDTLGKIRNPCVLYPIMEDKLSPLEMEIIRLFEIMPDWNPGIKNGKKVPVRLIFPIDINWQ